MGRPKEHDEQTRQALLQTAEGIVERDGLAALSVRRVAAEAGTTTRAVYSLFGSKDGLVVALGARAFELLGTITDLEATEDPAGDLIEAGISVFRRFAVGHPSLFALAVQRGATPPQLAAGFMPVAAEALAELTSRVARAHRAGQLGGRSVRQVVVEFDALCEGLAAVELRGMLPAGQEEEHWRDALTVLVRGFTSPARAPSSP